MMLVLRRAAYKAWSVLKNFSPRIYVTFRDSFHTIKTLEFHHPFSIGRNECEICIASEFVSRTHARVDFQEQQWWLQDLNSSNGIFVDGKRVDRVLISKDLTVRLGVKGPDLAFSFESTSSETPRRPDSIRHAAMAQSVARYFGEVNEGDHGEHTIMVRRAFAEIQKKQRWLYVSFIVSLFIAAIALSSYTFHLHRQVNNNKATAESLFYSMKALDLNIANVEKGLQDAGHQNSVEAEKLQRSRRETEVNYDRFLTTLKVYDSNMTVQRRLILRVARVFGECELAMPPAFAAEVESYIKKWQSSGRFSRAIALAKEKGYNSVIYREFRELNLPPQFFYLALQESDFDPFTSGPATSKGYAKGMWQFIPETGARYGLKIGLLSNLARPDTGDDRFRYERATRAAAQYINDLYRTDAQASGLLVMACYNWGENRVLPLVQSLPANPRERNFWQLLAKYRDKIPPETYDYVFYIVSAAVIGEDPKLFGFDLDNPLLGLEKK